MLCGAFFALGYEIAFDKSAKENFEMIDKLARNDDERKLIKEKRAFYKDLSQQTYVCIIFSILIMGLMLAMNIWAFRDEGMIGLKKGKYGC